MTIRKAVSSLVLVSFWALLMVMMVAHMAAGPPP